MTTLKKVKSHLDVVEYFKELSEILFYEELNVVKQIMRLEDMQ